MVPRRTVRNYRNLRSRRSDAYFGIEPNFVSRVQVIRLSGPKNSCVSNLKKAVLRGKENTVGNVNACTQTDAQPVEA